MKKYFLEQLENYGTKKKIAVEEQIDNGTLTIEHILPQTINAEWQKSLGENWELTHSKYKDTIGNLTLTAYNSDYSNLSFVKKRDMQDKGFIYSKLDLNKSIKTCSQWNEDSIKNRANELYQIAEKIWWLPENNYYPDKNEQWIYWDEEFEFKNTSITKIKFMGDEVITKDITDVYKKIHLYLYDLDSVTYLKSENHQYSSTNIDDFRKPIEISSGIYIESNLNSSDKINRISKLAKLYELDSHDIQFLVEKKKIPFDINNEDSYNDLTVGKLAYEFFKELIKQNKISFKEIENLKDKKYTKNLFDKTDYPAVAANRDDNRGNSSYIRYKKDPLKFEDIYIYISTQWFEGNRNDLIKWYKSHL